MDISEIYIKMCEKTKEIQHQWQPQEGDYVLIGNENYWEHIEILINGAHSGRLGFSDTINVGPWGEYNADGIEYIENYKDLIWLPRQD